MSGAKVTSIPALEELRTAAVRLREQIAAALAEADAEVQRAADRLRHERVGYWQRQVSARHDQTVQARAAIHRKEMTSLQEKPSTVDERKAFERAQRREAAAVDRLGVTRRWAAKLEQQSQAYKGATTSVGESLLRDLDAAAARLRQMSDALHDYARIGAEAPAPAPAPPTPNAPPGPAADPAHSVQHEPDAPTPLAGALADASTPDVARLRRRVPGAQRLAAAPRREPLFKHGPGPECPPEGLLARLGLLADPFAADAVVAYHAAALLTIDLAFHRLDDGTAFIQPLAAEQSELSATDLWATPAPQLTAVQPGFAELLDLPRGCVAIIFAGRVDRVVPPGEDAAAIIV